MTTLLSAYMDLEGKYNIESIHRIENEFNQIPRLPHFEVITTVYPSAILITFVSFVSTFSLGKLYSKQHSYEICANQELLALGAANTFSSFFLCYPCASSMARSAIQNRVGGRTQLASIISSAFLFLFILYFSTFFNSLPTVRIMEL